MILTEGTPHLNKDFIMKKQRLSPCQIFCYSEIDTSEIILMCVRQAALIVYIVVELSIGP